MNEADVMQQWMKELCASAFRHGNEILMLVASANGDSCQHFGSNGGDQFITKYSGLKKRFATFCRSLCDQRATQETFLNNSADTKSVFLGYPVMSPVTSICIIKEETGDAIPADYKTEGLADGETEAKTTSTGTTVEDPIIDLEEAICDVNAGNNGTSSAATTSKADIGTQLEAMSEEKHNLRPKPAPAWKSYKPKQCEPVKKKIRAGADTDLDWVPERKRICVAKSLDKKLGSVRNRKRICLLKDGDSHETVPDKPEAYCFLCERSYKSKAHLKAHMRYHNDIRPVSCDICDMQFKTVCDKKKHVRRIVQSAGKCFGCKTCHKHFKTEQLLGIHHLVPCEPTELYNFQDNQQRRIPCVCDACGLTLPNRGALERHKLYKHSDAKDFQCSVCAKQYRTRERLLLHVTQQHTDEYPHHCTYTNCSEAFKTRGSLRNHIRRIHQGIDRCQCDICGSTFTSLQYMRKHRLAFHVKEVKDVVCDVCGLDFHFQDKLKNHMIVHSNDRQHCCTVCPKRFKTNAALKKHMCRKHDEKRKRDCICDVCGMGFHHTGTLYLHRRTKHEHHLFKCKCCNTYPFKSTLQLKIHLAKFHAEEAYEKYNKNPRAKIKLCKCDICKEIFPTARYLTRHKANKHMTEKPYVCRQCGQEYGFKEYLDQHEKTHKSLAKYLCDLCHKRFTVLSGIVRHMKIMHKIDCEDGDMSYIGCSDGNGRHDSGESQNAAGDAITNASDKVECHHNSLSNSSRGGDVVTLENEENITTGTSEVVCEIVNDNYVHPEFLNSPTSILQATKHSNSIEFHEVHGTDIYESFDEHLSVVNTQTEMELIQ